MNRWSKLGLGVVGLLLAIQLVPYGRTHTNPDPVAEPAWDSPRTRELAVAACFDCHSNETAYPWYTNLAPISWLTQHDIEEGRRILNFSEWTGSSGRAHEAAETIVEGEMPPPYYTWLHGDSRLDDQEKADLAAGLRATLGG